MVVRCKAARDTEAWYNDNKDQIFASFGTLYSAQMSVDGIDPRSGEAYPDMCLVSNSASYTQTGEYVITFVYETLTAVWTKEQDDEVTSTDNGLRVLERSEVAKVDGFPIVQLSSPNSSKVVLSGMGNASNYFVLLVKANSANTIYWRATNEALATYTGSFTTVNTDQWEYKVIYTPISIDQLEIGYDGTNYSTFDLSEFYLVSQSSDWQNNIVEGFIKFEVTVDNPGTFTDTVVFTGSNGNTATGTNVQGGGTGSISSPYDEDDVGVSTITDGGKTLYLAGFKDETQSEANVQIGRVVSRWMEAGVLSRSEDKVGSQLAITIETFGEAPSTPVGYSLARTEVSNFEGINTNRYTFLKPSVLSRSEDKVGSQLAIVIESFGEVPDAPDGYSLARTDVSDFEGIKTNRYTFLKNDVQLTQGNDYVGSQLAITQEWFNPSAPKTVTDYSLAREDTSDVDGIPTTRYTFLKNDVQLSEGNDYVGSQLAITQEWFNPSAPKTVTDYSLAREDVSDVDGIPTVRYTFLKDDVQLSEGKDYIGSQLAITEEWFNPTSRNTKASYSLAREDTSDVDGIPTTRYTFLKPSILSLDTPKVGGQQTVVVQAFNQSSATVTSALSEVTVNHKLVNEAKSDYEGIQTSSYTFEVDDFDVLSATENGLKLITKTELSTSNFTRGTVGTDTHPTDTALILAGEEIDNGNTIKKRVSRWAEAGTLNRSEDKVGSQQAITIQAIGEIPATPEGYSLARTSIGNYEGFQTNDYTFLKPSILSQSEDKVGSQLAIIIEAFGEVPSTPAGYSLARKDISNFEGIKTNRYTFLKPSVLSVSQERTGGATTVQVRAFELTEAEVNTLLSEVTSSHILISQSESDYDGIVTSQFTYEVDDFEIESRAEDGMEIIVRTELQATNFSSGVIGTSTYKTLFLIEENIDNGNAIKKRTSRYSEAGVLSISPLEEDGFSLAPSYVYVTTGAPASSMTGLVTPDGTALGTSVTWFEPKVQNVKGFPTYTQQVSTVSITGGAVKIHSVHKFFTITEPGIMSTGGAFNSAQKSGAATRYPQATQQPRTYRKKATVDVYLTTSNLITESEVAFTEEGVDWCSIGFDSFYTNELDSSASVSSSWRSFPQYLNSSGTTDVATASSAGVYFAEANSYGAGDGTYTTAGIYRVELEKYTRAFNGTQLYLKTIVTF